MSALLPPVHTNVEFPLLVPIAKSFVETEGGVVTTSTSRIVNGNIPVWFSEGLLAYAATYSVSPLAKVNPVAAVVSKTNSSR